MSSIPLPALSIRPPEQPNMLQNIGQLLTLKNQMQQGQAVQQENELRAMQIKDQTTLRSSAQGLDWSQPDTFDKWLQNAQQKGVSPQTLSQMALQRANYKEQLAKTDKATLDAEQERNNQLLGHIDAIKNEKDPAKRAQVASTQAAQILNGGLVKDPGMTQMLQAVAQGQKVPTDDELQSFEIGLTDHKTQVAQAIEQQKANAADWKEFSGMGVLVNSRTGEVKTPAGQQMTPGMLESKYVAIQQKKNMKQPLAPEEDAFAKSYEKMKTLVPSFNFNLQQGALTGSALDQNAEKYWQTGQLPTGMRSPGMASSIMNRAAALHPEGSLAGNAAAYGANKKSYDNATKTLDTLTAFENVGKKNLENFLNLAKDIPDTGVPWLNKPIRTLSKDLVGSDKMPAIDAARTVALREIARITNDPKLSGVLSDSARQEVEGLIPSNATFPQIKKVTQVLLTDVQNVHESVAAQKTDIGKRLGIQATADTSQGGAKYTPPTGAKSATGPNGHRIVVDGGKWVDAETGKPI